MKTNSGFPTTCLLMAMLLRPGSAQWTYPNCANAVNADFTVTHVVGKTEDPDIEEPLKMDFQRDELGNVDIYYVQRMGDVKMYEGKSKTVKTLGHISVQSSGEDGLAGLALDPDFKTTNRLFVFYSDKLEYRISRFQTHPITRIMDMASEKILLKIPSSRGRVHTSGAMKFDAYGDLWINVGDNASLRKGPANTADYRGGILRIHPKEDGTYSIPAGNMWEFAANYFTVKGKPAVAAKYRDSAQMKREIYVKGTRNAYTLTLDPVRRWATWGDCGPDQESSTTTDTKLWSEEHNIATEPLFGGWPFWTALQHVQSVYPPGYGEANENNSMWGDWSKLDPNAPINDHPDAKGVDELLPAMPGTNSYAHSCAMTGPIYRYDGALASKTRLPPHFNRIWFVTDFDTGKIKGIHLSDDGKKTVGAAVEIFSGLTTKFNRPLDFQQGPDGSLYYLNHSCGTWHANDACTGIHRIDYKGTCQDPKLRPESPVTVDKAAAFARSISFSDDRVRIQGGIAYTLEVIDVTGRTIRSLPEAGGRTWFFDRILRGMPNGIYFLRVANAQGELSRKVAYFGSAAR
jgi:cytochrome c